VSARNQQRSASISLFVVPPTRSSRAAVPWGLFLLDVRLISVLMFSLHRLRVLRCIGFLAPFFPNDSKDSDPFSSNPCRIAVRRRACRFVVIIKRSRLFYCAAT
jgi:hypothetical protein